MIEIDITKRIKTYSGTGHLKIKTAFHTNAITQIIGPSGAGKTTLLKIIAGLINVEEGYIKVDETLWLDSTKKIHLPTQQRNIGFVFQDYALFPNMTVEEHLQFGTKDNLYIGRLLKIGRMEAFKHHKPRHLSGGQQQRLAILRALSIKPKFVLMDEPFSALDNELKMVIINDLLFILQELEATCLIVTHQPIEDELIKGFRFELS